MKTSGMGSYRATPAEFSGREEPSELSLNSERRESLATDYAAAYREEVREIFTEKGKYEKFLEVMKNFKDQKINTADIVTRMKELFQEHQHLIFGFNTFLPKDFQITVPVGEDPLNKKTVDIEKAVSFINKLRANTSSRTANFLMKAKTRFQHEEHTYRSLLEILNQFRLNKKSISQLLEEVGDLFQEHQDLLEEFTRFHPHGLTQCIPLGKTVARYLRQRDVKSSDDAIMRHILEKERITSPHVEHPNYQFSSPECDREQKKSLDKEKEREKERNIGNICSISRKRKSCSRTGDLDAFSQEDSDADLSRLQERWNFSMETRSSVKSHMFKQMRNEGNKRVRHCDSDGQDKNRERDPEKQMGRLNTFSSSIAKDSSNHILSMSNCKGQSIDCDNGYVLNCKDKSIDTPISKLDLPRCRKVTPSYRLLPKKYQMFPSIHRNEQDATVLNDVCVSVTCGNEDFSFKHLQRNEYEEIMFRCEDDRYEVDMLLETTKMAAKHVEDLLLEMRKKLTKPEGQIQIEDFLNVLDLRCIERLYEDHALDTIDLLRNNPTETLPIILARLKQKYNEWAVERSHANIFWAEVYAKNHWRSLDHRSLHFKQQDKKNLSTKELLAEIKVTATKQEMIDVLREAASSTEEPMIPELEFEYPDSDVHEDVYKIIKHSCRKLCHTEQQLDLMMIIWCSLLESMFGVPPRSHSGEATREVVKLTNHAPSVSETVACAGEGKFSPGADGIRNPKLVFSFVKHGDMPKDYEGSSMSRLISGNASINQDGFHGMFLVIHKSDSFEITPQTAKIRNLDNEMSEANTVGVSSKLGENSLLVDIATQEYMAENMGEKVTVKYTDFVASNNFEVGSEERELPPSADFMENHFGVPDASLEPSCKLSACSRKSASAIVHYKNNKRSQVFYGNNSFYVLFRLHQILYDRILLAKINASSGERNSESAGNADTLGQYARFMDILYSLLDGTIDNFEFEEKCHLLIGIQKSYILFTLDKLIFKLVKQLQAIASDEMNGKLLHLYAFEKSRSPKKLVDFVFRKSASSPSHEDNIYRFRCSFSPTRLSIQVMDSTWGRPGDAGVDMDLGSAEHLSNSVNPVTQDLHQVFLKKKYPGTDGHSSMSQEMEGMRSVNGLRCKIPCNNSKVKYVFGSEDVMYRTRRKKSDGGSSNENSKTFEHYQT